ncbi:MAG: IS1634 family transposase [Magnetococcus sp. YQC-3]
MDRDGRPLAVEVFEGNTADPVALSSQVDALRKRHGFRELIIVGDRGMITQARIDNDLAPNQLFWISALRNDAIKRLAKGPLQPSLFDERNIAEISSPDYPDERLTGCRDPFLADERARNRRELLTATETGLRKVQEAIAAGRLKECGAIGRRVEGTLRRFKMAKHFRFEIKDGQFVLSRNEESIAAEAALDGICAIRTNVPKERLDAVESVRQYKGLARVERAFRTIKTGLDVRPIFHHLTDRVRAHIFLCMLAYYVEWEMRNKLAPLLFSDEFPTRSGDPVVPAQASETAKTKTSKRQTSNGFQVHSFQTLFQDPGTLARNWITPKTDDSQGTTFTVLISRHADKILGTISCFDRIVVTGTFPDICHARAMASHLTADDVRLFDYPLWAELLREIIRTNAEKVATDACILIKHLRDRKQRKEDIVQQVLAARGSHPGLVVLTLTGIDPPVLTRIDPPAEYSRH